jgi:hypothetical protein
MFRHGITLWLRFRDRIRQLHLNEGYRYLLNTDLVSYFDHVNQQALESQLIDHGVQTTVVEQLMRLLGQWQTNPGVGLPQGHNPSSFLGNMYLDPVDKVMVREGYTYLRYVDDIYVFANSRVDLKKALKLLTQELRRLGLHIQEAKTEILQDREILQFVDERQDQLQALDYAIAADEFPLAVDTIKAILREMGIAKFNERHFRKCLNDLKKLKSDVAVKRCLTRLEKLPHAAKEIGEYLALFVNRKSVKNTLAFFLQDGDKNLYEWQEAWFLWTLHHASNLPREFLNFCRLRVRESEHWLSRARYALILGHLGDSTDRQLVQTRLAHCANRLEQRAFVAALSRLQPRRRNELLNQIERTDPVMAPVCNYVRTID